ncbi:MAG: IMPACT family protein [Flavobacteriales bacterium]|nr:IMPACT family protein [Flavobacteriales bacterium]
MMSTSYLTIEAATEGLFKDRGSKFLAYTYPITHAGEVKPLLEELKALHPSARHVCYAYQLGTDGNDYRANDDGEPNGSAGLPILNQIKSKEVTNVLVAVVRYFGGTKLGVSGLVTAYKEAAKDALEQAIVVEKVPMASIRLQFPHSSIGDVERTIRQHNWSIKDQYFGMDCRWTVEVVEADLEHATELFSVLPDVILIA